MTIVILPIKKDEFVGNQVTKLHNHIKIREIIPTQVLMDLDATSLYPSAMWDEKLV